MKYSLDISLRHTSVEAVQAVLDTLPTMPDMHLWADKNEE